MHLDFLFFGRGYRGFTTLSPLEGPARSILQEVWAAVGTRSSARSRRFVVEVQAMLKPTTFTLVLGSRKLRRL